MLSRPEVFPLGCWELAHITRPPASSMGLSPMALSGAEPFLLIFINHPPKATVSDSPGDSDSGRRQPPELIRLILGSVIFGGVDTKKYKGKLKKVPARMDGQLYVR